MRGVARFFLGGGGGGGGGGGSVCGTTYCKSTGPASLITAHLKYVHGLDAHCISQFN